MAERMSGNGSIQKSNSTITNTKIQIKLPIENLPVCCEFLEVDGIRSMPTTFLPLA